MRVANTAAPSFQSQANVGQYGWTGADQGHYNQLIQYVDECRKIWLNLEEKILYVETILETVTNIDAQVKYIEVIANEVMKWRQEVIASRDQINRIYEEVKPLYEDFTIKYPAIVGMHTDVIALHKETLEAQHEAASSEVGAKEWYDKSKDLYDDLKEGQVYRGTWDPTTNVYPDHQGTNSVWDVILPTGTLEHNYGGFLWRSGDRLLYVVSASSYQQLATGSGVASINGKVGAVTLAAADVGAISKTGDISTGRFEFRETDRNRGWPNATVNDPDNYVNRSILASNPGNNTLAIFGDDRENKRRMGIQVGHAATGYANAVGVLELNPFGGEVRANGSKVLTTTYLPTPNQIGAIPTSGGTITGSLNWVDGNKYINSAGDHMYVAAKVGRVILEGDITPLARVKGSDYPLYHSGNKPTPSELGVVPTSASRASSLDNTQKIINPETSDLNRVDAGAYGLYTNTSGNYPTVGGHGSFSYVETKSIYSTHAKVQTAWGYDGSGAMTYRHYNQNASTWTPWRAVYDTVNKPTAADVGAISKTGDSVTGSISFTETAAPLVFNRNAQTGMRFNTAPGVTTYLGVGTTGTLLYGNNADYSLNHKVYHNGDRPTPGEIGAVPSTGGVVDGRLTLKGANAAITFNPPSATESSYLLCTAGNVNNWYVGKGGSGDDIALHSYKHNTNISLQGDKVVASRKLYVGSSPVLYEGNLNNFGLSVNKFINVPNIAVPVNTWTDLGITTRQIEDAIGSGCLLIGGVLSFPGTGSSLGQYGTQVGFTSTLYAAGTNSPDAHLIPTTTTGHATNAHSLQLRWLFVSGGASAPKLQIFSVKGGNITSGTQLIVKRLM